MLALAAANTSRIWLGPGVTDAQEIAALRDFNVAMSVVGSDPKVTALQHWCPLHPQ